MVHWFQGSFPDGCLGDEVLTGDLSLGAHLCVLDSADGQGCRGCLQVLILHLCVRKVSEKKPIYIFECMALVQSRLL